jgi:hypothetical protein
MLCEMMVHHFQTVRDAVQRHGAHGESRGQSGAICARRRLALCSLENAGQNWETWLGNATDAKSAARSINNISAREA